MSLADILTPLDIFDPSSYPTRRDEEWKYSDLSRSLRQAPDRPERYFGAYNGPVAPEGFHLFIAGAADYDRLPVEQKVAKGKLAIVNIPAGDGDFSGYQGNGQISLTAGEALVLFERYEGAGQSAQNTTLHFKLGEGAKLTRIVILDEPEDAVSIRRSTVETAPGSVFKQYVFSTGAKFQRFETHVAHAGHGAEVEMHGAYLLKGKRHFDLTTRVTHAAIDGVTNQLIKGLVKDSATGVFQGRILVERGADGTDARMRHQALMLNDGAHIRAKPELEIYADDVQCAHGNTIGALDAEAMFFCQSRGMSEDQARALLTHAFVMPVAEMIEDEDLRARVLEFLEAQADALQGGIDAV